MTQGNKLTATFCRSSIQVDDSGGTYPDTFLLDLQLDNSEWEIVKAMPEGTDDMVEFSSPSKEVANKCSPRPN